MKQSDEEEIPKWNRANEVNKLYTIMDIDPVQRKIALSIEM